MLHIFNIFFMFLFLERSKSFTFKQCESSTVCIEDVFEEDVFTSSFVNDLYNQNTDYYIINVNITDVSELTLNLDGFNHDLSVEISNDKNLQLTIRTNINEISAKSCLPSIFAENADVIIENINEKNDKTLFVVNYFEFKSLSIKNQNKPLYLIHYFGDHYDKYPINSNLQLDTIYIGSHGFVIYFETPIENSLTIWVSPFINFTQRYSDEDPCFIQEADCIINTPNNTIITYGKKQIKYEFSNKKVLTIISETLKVNVQNHIHQNSVIDIENGLSSNDIFSPYISGYSDHSNSIIKGNWPIFKKNRIPGEFMSNGSYIDSFRIDFQLHGHFLFAANHFPITYFYNNIKLILTEKSSSIYLVKDYSDGNITIETRPQNSNDEFVFYIEGRCIELDNYTSTYGDGTTKETSNAIITSSDKLTIIANTYSKIQHFGPANLIYRKIDNSGQQVKSTLPFLSGGTINIPFSVDYMEIGNSLAEIYESYSADHPTPGNNAKSAEWVNYAIDFAKNKIGDLSAKINNMANKVVPITVDLKQNAYSTNQKNRVVLFRNDFPFSALYQNGLNKASNAVCLNSGTLNINDWDVRIGTNILRTLFGGDEEEEADEFFDQYLPTFSETQISGEIISNDNGKCIAYKPSSIPGSSFELIIYTSNTTFSQILEKISLITTLTTSDLDAFSKLKNSNSKNFVVVVLDDLPDGKSINLNGIREDANVFLIGYKTNQINEIFTMIDDLDAINWSDRANDDANDLLQNQIMSKFASKYENYQPKASITFGTVQSFLVGLVNYNGAHIKCKNFYPLLSKFSNVAALANDFSADITLTESITYKTIESLQFKDLVIFPVSINPPNIFNVDQIDFTESKWKLKMTALAQSPGLAIEGSSTYEINTAKISGQLIIYSFTSNCVFNVPDTKDKQKIKGITVNSHFTNFNIKEIPGIMILEEENTVSSSKKIQEILRNVPIQFMHEFFGIILKPTSIITKMTQLGIKKRKVIREDEEKIFFNGNWDKVESITGSIEINTGDYPAIINNIPTVVANVLEVKSSQNIQLETKSNVMKFTQPQIITQSKTISFSNENMDVSFTNLTFKGSSTGLSLMLNGKPSKVITDHVVLTTGTKSYLPCELDVKQSFEFGPQSSLVAEKITTNKPKLTMNYKLEDGFGTIPDSIEPDSIILNYIGESNGDSIPDYESYLGSINDVKTFTGENHKSKCNEWKGKTTLDSLKYPEFRGENPVVQVLCIDKSSFSTLSVNVSAIPNGIIQLPGQDDNVDEKGSPKKKKLSTGAIIGIAVGAVAVVAIVSVLIWFFVSRKKKVSQANEEDSP